MTEGADIHATWIVLVGLAVIAAGAVKAALQGTRIPALVGYLLLGMLLSLVDARWGLLSAPVRTAFDFLADVGVIVLLFSVGLTSHPAALARKLPQAMRIWIGDVVGSGLFGFVTVYYGFGLGLIPALMVATALTATSVGVSVGAWQDAGALDTDTGQLLLDVAELDDISAVALMALLFALIPVLERDAGALWSTLASTGGLFIIKFAVFIGLCVVFSFYAEQRVMQFAARREAAPERMLTVLGIGMITAALAEWLGFSLAIGALFAGLMFSRDPQAVRTRTSFKDLYAFVTPFFFINIGLHVNVTELPHAAGLGLVLLAAAILGKFIGAGLPALLTTGAAGASLIGVSMIPRAEIAMVVMHQGQRLGAWAVPDQVYAGMVLVSAATCLAGPIMLPRLLRRWPQGKGERP